MTDNLLPPEQVISLEDQGLIFPRLAGYGKVLFVDDEQSVLAAMERLFLDSEITVLKATDAREALAFIEQEAIAVIVSDNMMPGMKGIELLARVKELRPDTIRIMMTAYADLEVAIAAINQDEVYRFVVKPWDDDWLFRTVLEAVDRFNLIKSLQRSDESTLLSLAQTIELKDSYTRGHCDRVASYALRIVSALNLPEEMRTLVKYGSWLHDCGKIGIPRDILNKQGRLSEEEFAVIKKHPVWGLEVARQAMLHQVVLNIIQFHHEKYDGSGYPTGIGGKDIPLEARIVAVADVYDALTTDRPYRRSHPVAEARAIMLAQKGKGLDPEMVDIFLALLDAG